jgi:hypothetical protein
MPKTKDYIRCTNCGKLSPAANFEASPHELEGAVCTYLGGGRSRDTTKPRGFDWEARKLSPIEKALLKAALKRALKALQ